jgi:hypothetical protein
MVNQSTEYWYGNQIEHRLIVVLDILVDDCKNVLKKYEAQFSNEINEIGPLRYLFSMGKVIVNVFAKRTLYNIYVCMFIMKIYLGCFSLGK